MKELRYIFAVLFSSLIIVSGVGVSIIHYCCTGCETVQSCCSSDCSKCDQKHRTSENTCKDAGCTVVHYKVDMVKHAQDSSPAILPIMLLCEQLFLPGYLMSVADSFSDFVFEVPPHPGGSRQYLALYSVLLI